MFIFNPRRDGDKPQTKEEKIRQMKKKRMEEFKKAVIRGEVEDFLDGLNKLEIIFLKQDLGLMKIGEAGLEPLTEEQKKYQKIIEKQQDKQKNSHR